MTTIDTTLKYPHVVAAAVDDWVNTESGSWRLADALVEDIGEDHRAARDDPHTKTGLFAKLEEAYWEARDAGAKDLKSKTLARKYTTGAAWPAETRVSGASYAAHEALSPREFDGRREKALRRLVERSSDGWVGRDQVRLWKQHRKPTEVVPFLDQVERGLRSVLVRKGKPWNRLGQGDREAISKILHQLGNEVLEDDFGA